MTKLFSINSLLVTSYKLKFMKLSWDIIKLFNLNILFVVTMFP
ncbi:hypothetical protein SAMN05660703_2829 [Cellulophaga tyrosinoxydans]|uniref:Uncharacterized protein n=1 Tax=Cellulophaga tyrosinoxydans TaxID=504486 RepID=A0A1W2C683_9FLAO|nr:hypothetical protein SAMN05660703_2829 [Cellulophaga tyrosinoxydans]